MRCPRLRWEDKVKEDVEKVKLGYGLEGRKPRRKEEGVTFLEFIQVRLLIINLTESCCNSKLQEFLIEAYARLKKNNVKNAAKYNFKWNSLPKFRKKHELSYSVLNHIIRTSALHGFLV